MLFLIEIDDPDAEVVRAQIAYYLHGVAAFNRWLLRQKGTRIPRLYSSGVRYQLEPWAESYQSASNLREILARRWTECKGAAAWRLAELMHAAKTEEAAKAYDFQIDASDHETESGLVRLFHVRVLHPDGRIEDPSERLQQRCSA